MDERAAPGQAILGASKADSSGTKVGVALENLPTSALFSPLLPFTYYPALVVHQ